MSEAVGLLDTSVFIAREADRPIGELPDRVTLSVVTIGELELGLVNAPDQTTWERRAGRLALARTVDPVPISETIMTAWARLVVDCRKAGIERTVKLTDALIAATAIDLGLAVVTQDRDYEQVARAHPPLRVLRI